MVMYKIKVSVQINKMAIFQDICHSLMRLESVNELLNDLHVDSAERP
jgi:hypothetical protein